jgi:DNA repair exonuclease SbcCD ATPase subunit
MVEPVQLKVKDETLKADIEKEIGKFAAAKPIELPPADAPVTALYAKKIEGTYNVSNAKKDTDNAIDLLYIAYNTTPQGEDAIRNQITKIMIDLIHAQEASELAMGRAMLAGDSVIATVGRIFPDWKDVREVKGPDDKAGVDDLKGFLKEDVVKLAKAIKAKALEVKADLEKIAATYNAIVKETEAVTAKSETALASRLKDAEAVRKQIAESTAKREQLETLVAELAEEVKKYDTMAKNYASRADSAEERAFIMSIVQVGAQMLAGAIPAIVQGVTAAATGGASVVASAAVSTATRAVGDKNAEGAKDPPKPNDADLIQAKKDIGAKTLEANAAKVEVDAAKKAVTDQEKVLKTQQETEGKTPAATTSTEKPEKDDSETVKAIRQKIGEDKEKLKTAEEKYTGLIAALSGLQAAMTALEKGLGEMSKKAENAATDLRKLQMEMLNKVETYEKERRNQNGELIKLRVLLQSQVTEQDTLQLAIQSLNVSISALKKTQEIIHEIAHFFTSFAAFMDQVVTETDNDIQLFDDAIGKDKVRQNYFTNLILGTDKFFLRQIAEWNAIRRVSEKFQETFAGGRSKLNKLRGDYITGDKLKAYLKEANTRIGQIVSERESDADQKVKDLESYRQEIAGSATKKPAA